MSKKLFNFAVSDEDTRALRELSEATGISQSAIIRALVREAHTRLTAQPSGVANEEPTAHGGQLAAIAAHEPTAQVAVW